MADRISNANTRLAYVAETIENTTPATPAFQVLRATGESISVDRNLAFSSELDGRRGQKNHAVASIQGSGGVDFEFSPALLDAMLESVLRNAWNLDVLTDGNTPKSFTLEATYEGGATDLFKRLTGAQVNSLTLNLSAGENVTGSLAFMSRGADFANAAIVGATYADGGTDPIEAGDDISNVVMSGLTLDCVQSITMTINNNLTPEFCLGQSGPGALGAGALEVTGGVNVYLTADQYSVLRAYADGTATSLAFDIGASLAVSLPNVIIESLNVASTNADGSVIAELGWRALQAVSLNGSVIEITRVP